MNHTPEPWVLGWGSKPNFCEDKDTKYLCIYDAEQKIGHESVIIATIVDKPALENVDIANAQRIVACVNACAGIRTEALESGLIKYLLNDAYMRTLNPFDPNPQNKMDMKYLGKPVYEEDFEEVENGKD